MKHTLLLLAFTTTALLAAAQQTKTPVAVFPFVPATMEYKGRAVQIQEMVMETIKLNPNIDLIDRSKDSLLMKELEMQIREQSVSAKGLVDQGKVVGARNMIVGMVSHVSIEEKHTSGGFGLVKPASSTTLYTASVSFSLQLSDVETGAILAQKSFSNKGNKGLSGFMHVELSPSQEGAILQAVRTCQKQILEWLDVAMPSSISIIRVEDRDPSGYPKTLLMRGIASTARNGSVVTVNEIEMVDAGNGQMLKRTRKLVGMRVSERQGDITVCRITGGEKLLDDRMKAGAKLECIMVR